MKNPYGLAYHDQWIYVADTGNNRIQVFDRDGNLNKILEQDLNKPTDIVCHSDGTLYISDQNNQRIISIESNGYTCIYELNRYPDRIDIDGTGNLYISSYDFEESKRKVYTIQKLNTRTKEIVFTCALPNDYTLDTLQDIAVTQEGYTIFAIFQGRESILQFNEKGSFSGEWEPDGSNNSVAGITVDLSNNIYIELTNKINKYSSNKK
ncbi:MAG: hypothetical protein OMM_05732 [Candidatus Magnetoglobus multicellularis str. Araruama]|uniref:NHL repeat containing protein n=1 Tax=Candidatus Magnetoglobus multicellularis str. Araruama TaxID=890399 RepID=A0A1V1NUJ8_9BACT|nr:MAG: hypothetical protein OMM_05732 [Candidatus Magnetoglobus multicellularis str. Araruama]